MDTSCNRIQNSFLRTEDQRDMLKKTWFICEFFLELHSIQHTTKEQEKQLY